MSSLGPCSWVILFIPLLLPHLLTVQSAHLNARQLCGKHLVNFLKDLCNNRFASANNSHVHEGHGVRAVNARVEPPLGVVDQCCRNEPCSFTQLLQYCEDPTRIPIPASPPAVYEPLRRYPTAPEHLGAGPYAVHSAMQPLTRDEGATYSSYQQGIASDEAGRAKGYPIHIIGPNHHHSNCGQLDSREESL